MNASTSPVPKTAFAVFIALFLLVLPLPPSRPCHAQDQEPQAKLSSSIAGDGSGTIVVEARGQIPDPPVFYTAKATSTANVSTERIEQVIQLTAKVIQGRAKTLSFGLRGPDALSDVQGENLRSWSVRREGDERFLDLHINQDATELKVEIKTRSDELQLPTSIDLTHLTPGESVGFDSVVTIIDAPEVAATVSSVSGFVPLDSGDRAERFQTASGGQIQLSLQRDGAAPAAVELVDTTLRGELHPDGKSIRFQLRSTANVTEPGAEIMILAGNAAVSEVPADDNYQLQLSMLNGQSVYQLTFADAGSFPVALDFVATLDAPAPNVHRMDITIAASAVVPLTLIGLESDLEFVSDQESVVPLRNDDTWLGFLPATGRAKLQWKTARRTGEGKLFFTTTGKIEAKVGTGLLRQDHQITYQVLQGELKSFQIGLRGPGEILDVQGDNIVGWKVTESGQSRQLDVTLSQPITGQSQINVRSQTPLGAFPVRVEGLRLVPIGAIRHSGFLRLTNLGSVRLEPTLLSGMNQLAPDQFPGDSIEARQVFVYRFPAAGHSFTVAADRIQPEVNVSELVLYELAETDRVVRADIELDIREAPIREWDFGIPSDYSVVSVTGASVADYITATAVTGGRRNLKVIFGQDVIGRQLVALHLEKSEAASEGDWNLPRIEYPEAKSVRGDLGIIGAPGFRISIASTDLLAEKPLSYFPKPTPNLQQAFRIRQPGWSATMSVQQLERSVQSDVFHLYSLSEETVYGSALINYFVTGSPVSEWNITVPATLGNVMVDGKDVRTYRREGDALIVSLHQPVMGAYTLLVTFEEKPDKSNGSFKPGQVAPIGVQGERGYIQVVSPMQVKIQTESISDDMLNLDPLELPAELRLLSTAPPLGTWQYTQRPFELNLNVSWFEPGTTATQVVEFAEANSRVSQDGELVTDVVYFVKTRGQRTLKIQLPGEPVRLWAVSVGGRPVTARQSDEATLIPIPGGTDPNVPVEVSLRLGKPAVHQSRPELALPTVFAPILKTQWNVTGDEKYVLVPTGGTVTPPVPVLRPSGLDWVAKRGLIALVVIALLTGFGFWACRKPNVLRVAGLLSLLIAIGVSVATALVALSQRGVPEPLQVSVPILAAGETIALQVKNTPLWRVNLSSAGVTALLCAIVAVAWSFRRRDVQERRLLRGGGILLLALGVLLQGDGAAWFYGLLAVAIFTLLFLPPAREWVHHTNQSLRDLAERRKAKHENQDDASNEVPSEAFGPVTPMLIGFALMLSMASSSLAAVPAGFQAADSINQQWKLTHQDARLSATGTITLSGRPGDRFLLLKAPAVLTRFEGTGLRLTKTEVAGEGLSYIVSIPATDPSPPTEDDQQNDDPQEASSATYQATFDFQLEAIQPINGVPVLTGIAAVQQIDLRYDEAGWDVTSPSAVRIETTEVDDATQANVLLRPGSASLFLKPQVRDVTTEETQFFVEASNLYLPGPGVVDGRHRLHLRTSQGQVSELNVVVPQGLTVSSVSGPVGSWQFDAESGGLKLQIDPAQSQAFDVIIETQRGLDPLPADVTLSPLKVSGANGEVGLVAIAFGPEAQPETLQPNQMSAVNLGDFDAGLITNKQAVLHRVYRYGAEGGEVAVRVAPVAAEVRVASKQVLSLGDERVVLAINFAAEISRAGLFQLSFPLPDGLEVESLTGPALHHWAELTENDQRQIILHLNGKTLGTQSFALALTGAAPSDVGQWEIPRFELNEATRQTGDLVVRPTTGIRLRTVSRQNVSETDPRAMGGEAQGALAFRLLQRDWNLVLGIEKLDPWVTGQVLHEVTLREGQTRTALIANFNVQNASVRSLQVVLPLSDADEIKTLRASGNTVSDLIRTAADSNVWEIQFKRRVVGKIDFRIEYERRGDRENDSETLNPAGFPLARQLSYFYAVRAGGRLELELDGLSEGWQQIDWSTVPPTLREAENRNAPVFALRAVVPASPLIVRAQRHSIADALKLRVAQGSLTTILSPTGDQLTAVEVTVEVIQRSSLSVGLPDGGELFSIFVNGESVNSIRQGGDTNTWQFYILPGIDDRTATVRFVYSVSGNRLRDLKLISPQLNVPLENIQWNVVAPKGFELTDHDGNLELISQTNQEQYDRSSYLSKAVGKRQAQAQQAAQLLEQANQLLQAGEQTKARWALNSVANQYALDAASNEDARVQLENLQTQQAIVGLNTRRQRLYLYNTPSDTVSGDNPQLREAAADNPILQQDQLNFRPQQLSQLLRGNTTEDNAVLQQIAARLVRHQRTTEPAPQAIIISLPEEGSVYTFGRTVQVAENAPLELDLEFASQYRIQAWQMALVTLLLAGFAAALAFATSGRKVA
ncbi:hypothetical protein NZK35_23370 [Stieleria sp. ICT_E10.1]|uniref:hypothetical protein n=1 Tax=Stieleria sedimenti TaxID=2976331 RepID=UPI00217F5B15|nr:hypothetical protein [Stieleria sedimenti]MCS7469601.1 hypothetical protein [Stieleria sedimenti]